MDPETNTVILPILKPVSSRARVSSPVMLIKSPVFLVCRINFLLIIFMLSLNRQYLSGNKEFLKTDADNVNLWNIENKWSGRQDLNLRPQRPERCALPC